MEMDSGISEMWLDNCPWAMDYLNETKKIVQTECTQWLQMVKEIGPHDSKRNIYMTTYRNQIVETLKKLNANMKDVKDDMLEQIEKISTRAFKLRRMLDLDVNHSPPNLDTVTYVEMHNFLTDDLRSLEELAEKKRDEFKALELRYFALMEQLGREKTVLGQQFVPSSDEIKQMQSRIDELKTELDQRHEHIFKLKTDIQTDYGHYKIPWPTPKATNKNEIVLLEVLLTPLTSELCPTATDAFAQTLIDCHRNVKKRIRQFQDDVEHYKMSLLNMWDKLDVPLDDRGVLYEKLIGTTTIQCTFDDLDDLSATYNKCKALVAQNLEVFVRKQRDELLTLWDKCFCAETAAKQFPLLHSVQYTDDLLDAHERELTKWQSYYAQYQCLFDMLVEYNALQSNLRELEGGANDPKRYQNRGGQLLKEAKTRKRLQIRITEMETKLEQIAGDDASEMALVMINGRKLSDYLSEKKTAFEGGVQKRTKQPQMRGHALYTPQWSMRRQMVTSSVQQPQSTPSLKRKMVLAKPIGGSSSTMPSKKAKVHQNQNLYLAPGKSTKPVMRNKENEPPGSYVQFEGEMDRHARSTEFRRFDTLNLSGIDSLE